MPNTRLSTDSNTVHSSVSCQPITSQPISDPCCNSLHKMTLSDCSDNSSMSTSSSCCDHDSCSMKIGKVSYSGLLPMPYSIAKMRSERPEHSRHRYYSHQYEPLLRPPLN